MKAEEFQGVAEFLLAGGPNEEGRQRSAISRFYYAAFLEARDRLKEVKGLSFKKNEAHQNVRRAFEWSDAVPLRTVGRLLEDLKKLREGADYDIAAALDQEHIKEAQSIASEVRTTVSTADLTACVDPLNR
jgi:uncharacterized protein (UPF0332 family)